MTATANHATTRIWLLRHAETAVPDVFHGAESDIGLSQRGERQAEAIAPVLAALRPDGLVSSAMLRARLTAQPIAQACGLPMQIEPGFHERRVGALVGLTHQAAEGVWPETLRHWIAGDTAYTPDGAESFDQLQTRLLPLWNRWTDAYRGRTLAIVAHGVVCKVLILSLIPELTPADWQRLGPIRNVALHELVRRDGFWEMPRFNELPAEVKDS